MPSSLTVNLSSALVCSTRPPVSVCGTGPYRICLAGFLGSMVTAAVTLPGGSVYCRLSAPRADLPAQGIPTAFNVLFRQHAGVSLLRLHIAPARGYRIFNVCPSGPALRLPLRPRLTLIRLALIRNPWSYGGGVSRTPYRYLCLHLLFPGLQRGSRHAFCGYGNAPLPIPPLGRIPRLRHRTYARLLSMRGLSTSELLRTLQMNGCFQANILAVSAAPPRYCLQLGPDFGALDGGLSCSSLGRGP